jgi:hypothetical protein
MLKKVFDRTKLQKKIAVCTGSDAFTKVLEGLLVNWGFEICAQGDPAVLLLAEEGCCRQVEGQKSIWMTRLSPASDDQIRLPVSVESLWQVLEPIFHHPPRLHLRIAVDISARLFLGGEWCETRLNSLSDMGVRFSTKREAVRQEPVTIDLIIDGKIHQYHGKVIFSMSTATSEDGLFQSGAVFVNQDKETCDRLRAVLIRWYLEAVRDKMDRQLFQDGLEFLDLIPEDRQGLIC